MSGKKLLIVVLLGLVLAGGVFAHDGFFRGTLNFGILFAPGGGNTPPIMMVDADYINKYGITFGLTQGITMGDDMVFLAGFSFGYTFARPKWALGIKLVGVGFGGDDGTGGFEIGGSFFFNNYIGITAMFDAFVFGDGRLFSIRGGLTIKI